MHSCPNHTAHAQSRPDRGLSCGRAMPHWAAPHLHSLHFMLTQAHSQEAEQTWTRKWDLRTDCCETNICIVKLEMVLQQHCKTPQMAGLAETGKLFAENVGMKCSNRGNSANSGIQTKNGHMSLYQKEACGGQHPGWTKDPRPQFSGFLLAGPPESIHTDLRR